MGNDKLKLNNKQYSMNNDEINIGHTPMGNDQQILNNDNDDIETDEGTITDESMQNDDEQNHITPGQIFDNDNNDNNNEKDTLGNIEPDEFVVDGSDSEKDLNVNTLGCINKEVDEKK
eukprot:391112_1